MAGAAAASLAIAAGLLVSSVFAATGGISVSDGTAAPGASGDITVSATNVTDPGLGAWTIDLAYDPAVLTPTGCDAGANVCNAEYEADGGATDLVRFTGANANGLDGTNVLGTVTFQCANATGTSDLTVTEPVSVFADATIGAPVDINPDPIDNGVFTCAVAPTATTTTVATPAATALPPTGTFAPDSGDGGNSPWLLASVAGIAAAVIAGFGAMRVRTRRA